MAHLAFMMNRMSLHTVNRVWCKIMIQRYLGVWLDNNLSVDQLSLELVGGSLELENLDINTKAVSAGLAQASVPLKLVDGYVGRIKIEIPWVKIMVDPTKMCIEDLQLTFRGSEIIKMEDIETFASMIESVLMSLSTDDMARSVLDEVTKENSLSLDFLGTGETADSFSGFINAVYSRFCLTIKNLTLRFENEPKDKSEMATAVEIHVQMITFMDEQMRSCEMDNTNATDLVTTQPHGVGTSTNLNKNLTFHGVSIHTDVFSQIDNDGMGADEDVLITSMHIRREKAKQMSPTKSAQNSLHPEMFMSAMSDMDAFHSCYDKLTQDCPPSQLETIRTAPMEPELFSNPIKCAEVIGDVSCVFRIKNAADNVNVADIEESKIETDIFVKGINVFATSSQLDIVKRFFASFTAPKEIVITEQGKPMNKEDYENMAKNMEPNQSTEIPIPTFGGNWNAGEEFREFEDVKSLKKEKEKSEKEKFKSLRANANIREEFTVKTHIGTFLMYIPHCDFLSADYAEEHGGSATALSILQAESSKFFNALNGYSFLAKHGLATIREAANAFYPKDHLRIVGGSLDVTSSSQRIGGIATFSCRVIANHFDILEYLTPESAPGSDGPMSINILDYSNQENAENDPNFKLILRKSSENKAETKLEVLLGAVKTELDLSIIDRISNLIVCRPFFDEASKQGGRRDKVPQLKDDLYADAAGDESVNAKTLFNLRCPSWQVDLRIPKADLRDPTGSRLPFSQRHVHNEYLALGIKEIDVSIPIGKEVPFIEILCSELYGDFCGEGLCIPPEQKRILYASKSGFDKINLTMKFAGNPDKDRNGERTNSSSSAVPDIMMKSISADIMMSHPKKEGPFSKTPRAYCSHDGGEKEEIIQAGSRKEILAFQQECEKFASTFLLFTIPTLKLHIPEKGHLEVLYNRFVNDLALFQPAAPAFRPKTVEEATGQPTESFQECVSPKTYAESEHSDLEDDVMTVKDETEGFEFNRDVRHTFVLTMNANRCAILCNTAVKDEEKAPEASQVALDLDKVHLGTTAGYHGDINHTYFHFTSSKAAVGSVCTTRGQRIPNVITAKDFGKWSKDFNQLEHVPPTDELSSGSTEDAFAVALHMSFKPDINVKDVLLGIAIRNSLLQARPIKNWGAFWITQLADLFTLQDYAIPGYVLPTITTDLHICLENDIIGYDHSWIIPSSKLKLRAALGHCNLASCIVSDMSISKTLCIFEHCRLYMSHDSVKDAVRFEGYCAPRAPTKKFMPFLEFGSLQLDILFAVGNETGPKTTPAFEIRCQNDIINAWACADSFATFIQTIMEYTSHEQVPTETPEDGSLRESLNSMKNDDITKSVATESVWSDASTGSKHVQKMAVGMDLPNNVSKRMQAMILEAAVENEEGAGIAIGEDAVKEFAMNEKKPTTSSKSKKKKTENFEQMVPMDFAITDEEFCMVDDNVFGSGITTLPGESRVRPMPGPDSSDEPPIKVDFFQCIEESGNDGLYQTMSADDLTPALRYFLKDVTLRLSLYAGNDLSTAPSPLRTYCTEEYRNGYGPEQKIEPNSAGGPNRDHSAFVVLELSKITYLKQVFEKTAPQLSTTLFQIGDVVIKDCVRASTIQEMLYQYSATSQPRRSSAPIFSVRMTESQAKEGKMRVSMLPIKINVDQDTLEFLSDFFEETSRHLDLPKGKTNIPLVQRPVIEVPAESNSRRTSPKTSVSSSEGDVTRMYPSLPEPSLTSEPLRPSPVHPATPLGDLSYLEKISSNHQSPVKRPIIDAPLTTSAMSIGKMFDTPRVYDDEEEEDEVDPIQIERTGEYKLFNEELRQLNEIEKSPADTLFCADYSSSESSEDDNNDDNNIPKFSNKLHEFVDPSHPADLSDLAGDWAEEDTPTFTAHLSDQYHNAPIMPCRATEKYCQRPEELEHLDLYEDSESGKGSSISTGAASSIKPRNKKELSPLKMPPQPISHEDILMRSTMMGSIHPTHSVHNLVDTGDDMDEHSNFLDSLDDDDDQEKQKVEQELEEDQKKEEEERSKEIEAAVERGETFFKQFVFSPEVNIYVDYQGKRKIAMEKQGALVGLLMAFGQLNQMPITLRKIDTRTGLLGSGRCMQHAVSEWSGDMLTNMPSVIASYGPISPLVQIGRGVVDLFWMPVSEFRKNDGNVIKGVQRGVGSFSVSSAAGIVGMAQTVTGFVQSLAEITMNEIKPDDPSNRRSRRYNRNHGTNPTDVRHSLQLAYGILYDGYQQTRDDLELAAQEDRASGNSVVRSAFRYAVPTFLGPIVMATQVTYQLLGGLRNQLRPDTYQDERRKWGEKDVPGGVNN